MQGKNGDVTLNCHVLSPALLQVLLEELRRRFGVRLVGKVVDVDVQAAGGAEGSVRPAGSLETDRRK